MDPIRIGVLCPSEIAFRRFLPALKKRQDIQYIGVACANEQEWFGSVEKSHDQTILGKEREKTQNFSETYGGKVFESYMQMLESDEIDAVYLPLPPALHFRWGKAALVHGKHVFMEKPFTTSLADTQALLQLASENNLAVHENYMFQYHSQIEEIQVIIGSGTIGEVRLIRIAFGFPFRGVNDFRYNKALGGGALLDCGGYTVKLASMLLGNSAKLVTSNLNYQDAFEVDTFGSATMVNDDGLTAQLSFGMDNSYKCELEIWGSIGSLYTNRILTAPEGFAPTVLVKTAKEEECRELKADDAFQKSIYAFYRCIVDETARNQNYSGLRTQAVLVEHFVEEKLT